MKVKKPKKSDVQPKARPGFRKLYFDGGLSDPRTGIWQWRYGGTVVLYSPTGERKLACHGELVGTDPSAWHEHDPITPWDIRKWIQSHGNDSIPRRPRRKPKETFWAHNGDMITVVRQTLHGGNEKVSWSVIRNGEVIDRGEHDPGHPDEALAEKLKSLIEERDVSRILEAMFSMEDES